MKKIARKGMRNANVESRVAIKIDKSSKGAKPKKEEKTKKGSKKGIPFNNRYWCTYMNFEGFLIIDIGYIDINVDDKI